MAITNYFKVLKPGYENRSMSTNADVMGYGGINWYTRLVRGSYTRLKRYSEYDTMDTDVDIARALDIIAEEMVGNRSKRDIPLEVHVENDHYKVNTSTIVTLKAALKTWCEVQEWHNRLFGVVRNTIKYGDCFFLRNNTGPFKKYIHVHPKHVDAAKVSVEDIYDIKSWNINLNFNDATASYANKLLIPVNIKNSDSENSNYSEVQSDNVIHFSLSDEMNAEAPFGESVLRAAYRTYKQKELLEDSVLIYRIARAPERRVFYIDTGKARASERENILRKTKNEFRQKKIPVKQAGKDSVEAVYDPQSIQEDFFFAVGPEGRASRVETLPGGAGLGNLDDLQYWFSKMWRAMRVPDSYMNNMMDGGGVASNDGRVGIAYMQEIKFSQYVKRLQSNIEMTLDKEFKRFLAKMKIVVDPSIFKVRLPSPSNFIEHKELAIDADRLNNFSSAVGIDTLSERFAMTKYLQLTPEEMAQNERLKREELGIPVDGGKEDLVKIYNPDVAEEQGFEGGIGGFEGGGGGGDMLDIEDGEFDEMEGELGEEGEDLDLGGEEGEEPTEEEETI
jgi:hypothetical protein